jgi:hypothetical protein
MKMDMGKSRSPFQVQYFETKSQAFKSETFFKTFEGRKFLNKMELSDAKINFCHLTLRSYFCRGEMAERSNAAVLKTVEVQASGGSNPSLSAGKNNIKKSKARKIFFADFLFY